MESSIASTDWTEVTVPCLVCAEPAATTDAACTHCGAARYPDERLRRRYSLWRVGLLGILSYGLYFFYWYYVSWKHLKSETGEDHRPFWHVLTLLVPIYGLFRFHAHLSAIQDLLWKPNIPTGEGHRAPSYLSPGWGTLVFWLAGIISWVVPVLWQGVAVGLMVLAQAGLNRYWQAASRGAVREAGFGAGEIAVTLLGASPLASSLLDLLLQ